MLVLFASLIGCAGWVLIKLCRWLAEPPDPAKPTAKKLERLNLNQLKRAGQ
jgi:ribosome biogenesis protein Tsr3